ncbi:response regulator [Sphingobium sp. CR28]|uniref:response regulator n=1 Tax=Sphingobium sp. CR28 TaxID=3400272 RepID=UPI003FEDF53A
MFSLSRRQASIAAHVVQRPSLQTHLIVLVLLVLVPTLGVVAATLARAGASYRQASTAQLLATANLAAQSVESELRATSHIIENYGPTRGTTETSGGALFKGRLGSTLIRREPAGLAARPVTSPAILTDLASKAASTGEMAVSNIFSSGASPQIAIAISRDVGKGSVEVATMVARPTDLVRTLTREGAFPDSLVLAVTDGTGRVVARSSEADQFIGKPVPDWATLKALGKTSGTFEARRIDGPRVIFAFQTIRGTPGWVAVVGEPLRVFNDRWRQPLIVLFAASAATLFFALLLAMLLARRILRPIRHLAQHARAVADGEGADYSLSDAAPRSSVAEFETLRHSLESAEVETRRSHQALQQSYEALRQAERLARIGSWSLDLASGHFTCSDMLYEINGADPAGPPLTTADLQRLLAPESLQRMNAAIAACIETGQPYVMEVEHLRADGPSFPAYIRGQAQRDGAGRIIGLAGTVQDISDRQEEQARLATLADNLPSGVIYRLEQPADGELTVTYMSAGIIRLTGLSADEITRDRMAFLNMIHPEDSTGYSDAMERSRLTGAPVDHTLRVSTRDGRLIWMHIRSAPRLQSDGRTIWDGIARDVTGERLAAEALHQAKEAAEAAERTKSDFLATMSHEIRTPMNTVIGMTRLTLQTPLAPKQRNYLEKIDLSAKALLGIINDVLDFSKIEAGGLELEDTPFTLESVLESVSAVMAMPAEDKGLEIAYAVDTQAPRQLRGDPLRLGQVLTNLVSNAVKFTETGEVVISIEPVLAEDGAPLLQFSVRDTGIGLSADQIAGLFRPFSQAASDTSRKYGGTGLGLAICKQLVEMMGGRIWVDSVLGEGSTFSFTIASRSIGEASMSHPVSRRSALLTDRRVLIVDDNASARQILREMVTEFGLAAETVDSGAGALARLRAEAEHGKPFDIVLMDWRMPTMDGLETARRIRADESLPHMPAVLMVTAYGREEVLCGAEQLGLEGVLIKPITESVMFNTISEIFSPSEQRARTTVKGSAPRRGKASREAYARLKGKRVLVVDDNALNREVASDFLAAVGVEADTATDGLEALAKLDVHDFDAVLMDMHMPRMDGLSAVREIRRHERWLKLPVIALTAQARIEDQNASREAGMTAHLSKPIDETALYQTLIESLGLAAGKAAGHQRVEEADAADFDLQLSLKRFGGNEERVERLLEGFLRDNVDIVQRLDDSLRGGDPELIASVVHTLKGSAAYFGARHFCTVADQLEQAARDGDMQDVEGRAPTFREALIRLIKDATRGLSTLRDKDVGNGAPADHAVMRDLVTRAIPLVEQGDYAANQLLEDICTGLLGQGIRSLAEEAQSQFDELELEAASAALLQLQRKLDPAWTEETL